MLDLSLLLNDQNTTTKCCRTSVCIVEIGQIEHVKWIYTNYFSIWIKDVRGLFDYASIAVLDHQATALFLLYLQKFISIIIIMKSV